MNLLKIVESSAYPARSKYMDLKECFQDVKVFYDE